MRKFRPLKHFENTWDAEAGLGGELQIYFPDSRIPDIAIKVEFAEDTAAIEVGIEAEQEISIEEILMSEGL